MNLADRKALALSFLDTHSFPIIAKPDRGVVGIGVRRLDSENDLNDILSIMPSDYMLQQFCDFPLEYGIFYCKFPDEPRQGGVADRKNRPVCFR